MKKTALLFLIFIYACSSMGVALKADYCCDKLQSLKLTLSDYSKDKGTCCKEKYQSFKVKDTHAATHIIAAPAVYFTFIHALNYSFQAINMAYEKNNQFANTNVPPLSPPIPDYISNCVFRI
ncbi:MAG TPA: hypothetical protein VFW07_27895 [Parafilimonas sp.]|nr:hypothetical protein [Parafilimonas sp.]